MSLERLHPPAMSVTGPSNALPKMTVHRLTGDGHSAVIADWQALFEKDEAAYSLQHPRVVLSECRFLAKSPLEPLLLACRRGDELVAAAVLVPKSIRSSKAGGLGPGWLLHGYRLAGSRILQIDPSADLESRLLAAALDIVGRQRAVFLLIEDLDQTSSLWNHIGTELPHGWNRFAPNGYQARMQIQFPTDDVDYWSQQFSSKTRSTFRRKMKKFGTTRLDRITSPDQVPAFLAKAHVISQQTWQSRHLGLRIRNDDGELAAFTALAEAGLLRSYLWHSNEEPAAFCVGNQSHGVFHYEEVGYATKFARFSPGQMLAVQMIDDLLAHDRPVRFDFGGGDADYKRMFANQVSTSGSVWITPPSWKARASLGWIHFSRGMKHAAKRVVNQLGLATRVRQWIRYGGQTAGPTTNVDAGPDTADEETSS